MIPNKSKRTGHERMTAFTTIYNLQMGVLKGIDDVRRQGNKALIRGEYLHLDLASNHL